MMINKPVIDMPIFLPVSHFTTPHAYMLEIPQQKIKIKINPILCHQKHAVAASIFSTSNNWYLGKIFFTFDTYQFV